MPILIILFIGGLLLYAVIPVTIDFVNLQYTGKSTLLQMWGHFILSKSTFQAGHELWLSCLQSSTSGCMVQGLDTIFKKYPITVRSFSRGRGPDEMFHEFLEENIPQSLLRNFFAHIRLKNEEIAL